MRLRNMNRRRKMGTEPEYRTIGRVGAPMFFWGDKATRATGRFITVRLILMGVGAIHRSHNVKKQA